MCSFRSALLAACVVFFLTAFSLGQPRPEFLEAPGFGGLPNAIVFGSGDFNGDGKLDFVEFGSSGAGVLSLLGKGDGTFRMGKTSPMSQDPNSVGVADFNHDGKLDIVTADFQNYVSVMLGNGDGSFQPFVNYPVSTKPQSVAVADFNRDGNADVVVVDSKWKIVDVLLGNGDGTLQSYYFFSAGAFPTSLVVADLNADQNPDLVVLNSAVGVNPGNADIVLGNGDGTFQTPTEYLVGQTPIQAAVADFNRDSRLDIAVANAADLTCTLLLGNGDGTFQAQSPIPVSNQPFGMVVGDFNGDQRLDLVTQLRLGVSLLLGNGDGTFQPEKVYVAGLIDEGVLAGRYNQDAKDDIAELGGPNDGTKNIFVFLGR